MKKAIRIRAKVVNDVAEVKALMKHAMETGNRKNELGKLIPAHYITEVTCHHKNKRVMSAFFGPAVSKNPYIAFKFKGAKKGDTIKMSFIDSIGLTSETEATLK